MNIELTVQKRTGHTNHMTIEKTVDNADLGDLMALFENALSHHFGDRPMTIRAMLDIRDTKSAHGDCVDLMIWGRPDRRLKEQS